MKKIGLAASLFAVLAAPVFAQQADSEQVSRFLNIISENGCSMTEAEAEQIFPQNGFDRDKTREIATQLISAGTVVFANGMLEIADGSCDASMSLVGNGLTEQQLQFIDIMALNNCSMTQDMAKTMFPDNGMPFSIADEVVDQLMDLGIATAAADGNTLVIGPDYCDASAPIEAVAGMSGANADAMYLAGTQVQRFIEIMAENGCSLHRDEAETIFTEPGLTKDDTDPIVGTLVDMSLATYSRETRILTLDSAICISVNDQAAETPVSSPEVENVSDNSPAAVFMSVMVQNGCILSETNARAAFATAGLEMEDVYSFADEFVAQGLAQYSDDDTILTLTVPECSAAIAVIEQPVEIDSGETIPVENVGNDPETDFLAMMANNGCEITQANAREMTATAGMDYNTAMGIASRMLNDGRASSPDGGQTLQISAPLCAASSNSGPMEPRDIFIEVLRGNNCSMTAAEFGMLLPVEGLDQNAAFGLITDLEAEGVISLPATRDVVTLTAGNCP